jgi:hypothetical protein
LKALISILFSFIIFCSSLLPSHNLAELSALTQIQDHYQVHLNSSTDQSLTLWQFFVMHYSPFSKKHDLDHEHHLPLYHQALTLYYLNSFSLIKILEITINPNPEQSIKYPDHYHFIFIDQILHPPKF